MSIACPHCGVKLHLDRMQFASKLPLQVRCWNCSETVKLGSAATAALDSAAGAQPDLNGGVRMKGPSKGKLHSGANKTADSPAKQKQDSASNGGVVSISDDNVTVLKANSAAIHKTDPSAVREAALASAVHKADSRSLHKADLPSVVHKADLPPMRKGDLPSAVAIDSRSGTKADSRFAKQPEPAEEEMGPRTIAVSSAKPHERSKDARLAGARDSRTSSLTLPQDKTIKISVMTGPSQGKEYDLSRPLVTLGRLSGGADIEIDDAEVSRVHCAVEMRRDSILLHDMRSTNGTFLGETRVFSARLEEMSTFRIGSTLLRVSFLASVSGRRNS